MKYFFSLTIFAMLLSVSSVEASSILTAPEKYRVGQIVKVLIVPGHDDENSGAVYKTTREEDMNLVLAKGIEEALKNDTRLSVTLTRNDLGYIQELSEYFTHEDDINDFLEEHIEDTNKMIESGDIVVSEQVTHNDAPNDVAFRLYAINKWATEMDFDMVIHIHHNDAWPRNVDEIGENNGYTIYIPDENLPNSIASRPLGESISDRLQESIYPSNHEKELEFAQDDGVAEDFKLIALGSNMTLQIPSILIEYSYIFEPTLYEKLGVLTREIFVGATKNGLYEYLTGTKGVAKNFSHEWETTLKRGVKENSDVVALQYTLRELGFYPPILFVRDDCPITGNFGPCTESAVKELQKSYKLSADGIVGPKTNAILNAIF